MNLFEALEKEREHERVIELIKDKELKYDEAFLKSYADEVFEAVFETTKYYNLKHISYLNHDEYRLYKIPFYWCELRQVGIKGQRKDQKRKEDL